MGIAKDRGRLLWRHTRCAEGPWSVGRWGAEGGCEALRPNHSVQALSKQIDRRSF